MSLYNMQSINENAFSDTDKHWEDYDEIVCLDGERIDMKKLIHDQDMAKTALLNQAPWLSEIISRFRFIYTFHVETQATDGQDIFINPQFTSHLDFTTKVFVMAHEALHCLLNHMKRGKHHEPTRSNIAADYEVNATLCGLSGIDGKPIISKESVIKLAKEMGILYNEEYDGWSYESIYDKAQIPNQFPPSPKQGGKQGGGGQGGGPEGGTPGPSQDNNQGGGQDGGQGGGQGGGQPQSNDPDYIKGWEQAMKDYAEGKIKI